MSDSVRLAQRPKPDQDEELGGMEGNNLGQSLQPPRHEEESSPAPFGLACRESMFISNAVSEDEPWICSQCEYQNVDSSNRTCALCGIHDSQTGDVRAEEHSVEVTTRSLPLPEPAKIELDTSVLQKQPSPYQNRGVLKDFLARGVARVTRGVGTDGSVSTVRASNVKDKQSESQVWDESMELTDDEAVSNLREKKRREQKLQHDKEQQLREKELRDKLTGAPVKTKTAQTKKPILSTPRDESIALFLKQNPAPSSMRSLEDLDDDPQPPNPVPPPQVPPEMPGSTVRRESSSIAPPVQLPARPGADSTAALAKKKSKRRRKPASEEAKQAAGTSVVATSLAPPLDHDSGSVVSTSTYDGSVSSLGDLSRKSSLTQSSVARNSTPSQGSISRSIAAMSASPSSHQVQSKGNSQPGESRIPPVRMDSAGSRVRTMDTPDDAPPAQNGKGTPRRSSQTSVTSANTAPAEPGGRPPMAHHYASERSSATAPALTPMAAPSSDVSEASSGVKSAEYRSASFKNRQVWDHEANVTKEEVSAASVWPSGTDGVATESKAAEEGAGKNRRGCLIFLGLVCLCAIAGAVVVVVLVVLGTEDREDSSISLGPLPTETDPPSPSPSMSLQPSITGQPSAAPTPVVTGIPSTTGGGGGGGGVDPGGNKDTPAPVPLEWVELETDSITGNSVSFAGNGQFLAVGRGRDNFVRVYEFEDGWNQIEQLPNNSRPDDDPSVSLSVGEQSGLVLAIGSAGETNVYDYQSQEWNRRGNRLDCSEQGASDVSVSLSAGGDVVAVGCLGLFSGGASFFRWDSDGNEWSDSVVCGAYSVFNSNVTSIKVSLADNGGLVAAGRMGTRWPVEVFRVFGVQPAGVCSKTTDIEAPPMGGGITALDLSGDGSHLAVSTDQQTVLYEQVGTSWRNASSLPGGNSVALNYDGSVIALGMGGSVEVFSFDGIDSSPVPVGEVIQGDRSSFGDSISLSHGGTRVAVSAPDVASTDGSPGGIFVYEAS